MAIYTLILLPTLPPSGLPLLVFYEKLLRVPPQTLGLTLAAITLGLLLVRRLDGRPAPLLFRAAAVLTAALTLASLTGLTGAYWPLATATGGVLLLLVDETVNLLLPVVSLIASTSGHLMAKARPATAPPAAKEIH